VLYPFSIALVTQVSDIQDVAHLKYLKFFPVFISSITKPPFAAKEGRI